MMVVDEPLDIIKDDVERCKDLSETIVRVMSLRLTR